MLQENEQIRLLAESIELSGGKTLVITEAPGSCVHVQVGRFWVNYPRFVIEGFGDGDFSLGLARTVDGLVETLQQAKII